MFHKFLYNTAQNEIARHEEEKRQLQAAADALEAEGITPPPGIEHYVPPYSRLPEPERRLAEVTASQLDVLQRMRSNIESLNRMMERDIIKPYLEKRQGDSDHEPHIHTHALWGKESAVNLVSKLSHAVTKLFPLEQAFTKQYGALMVEDKSAYRVTPQDISVMNNFIIRMEEYNAREAIHDKVRKEHNWGKPETAEEYRTQMLAFLRAEFGHEAVPDDLDIYSPDYDRLKKLDELRAELEAQEREKYQAKQAAEAPLTLAEGLSRSPKG